MKMQTTIVDYGYIGKMEKNMETNIVDFILRKTAAVLAVLSSMICLNSDPDDSGPYINLLRRSYQPV